MNTASLDLCKELYELSGWNKTQNVWAITTDDSAAPWLRIGVGSSSAWTEWPAYDLGYLMRQLPEKSGLLHISKSPGGKPGFWVANLGDNGEVAESIADTPEDAACKLAIELFKQGILKNE